MSESIRLSATQMRRIEPYFPLSRGVPRVDDRRIISGINFVIRNGLRWRDAPAEFGLRKTLQPLHPLEPARHVHQDFRGTGNEGQAARKRTRVGLDMREDD